MAPLILYSVNCFLKYEIQEKYRGGLHYVWVSEYFDGRSSIVPSVGPRSPPSSNPKDIYNDLKLAVEEEDGHCYKISQQKTLITARAIEWERNSEISTFDRNDIVFTVESGSYQQWRPLIYVIPYEPVRSRIEPVSRATRAGLGSEYRVVDLKRSEFDIIEP